MIKPGHKILNEVVKRVLLEDGEQSMHKYALYKGFALDFMRDFNMDASQEVKTVLLPVDSLRRVKLPDDYIDYIKIGQQVGDHVKAWIRDDTINLLPQNKNCESVANEPTRDVHNDEFPFYYGSYYFHNFNNINEWGEHTGGFYGFGQGRLKSGFTIHDGYIQLSSSLNNEEIYLEYVSNSLVCGDSVLVPVIAEQAMKEYVRWQEIECDRHAVHWEKVRAEKRYSKAMRLVRGRISKLTPEDIMWIMRDNFMMAPKT